MSDRRERVDALLNRHPTVGFAVGLVHNGSLEYFYGHGRDTVTRASVNQDTVFRIGSITKTFTAVAVMRLCEQGLIDLDAPANEYLRAFRLVPARSGLRPATVRHLLTHTSGVGEVAHASDLFRRLFGETVPMGQPVPPLARLYRGGLRVHAEPGTRFIYSDHGFTTLGQIVEDVTGQRLDRYLRDNVFSPLGMEHTDLVRSDRVRPRLATGYTVGSRGPKPVADYEVVTAAGGAAYSCTADMARFMAALLGGGDPIVTSSTVAAMFDPQYRPDPRIPGIGLAFWRGNSGGHPVVEHGGIVPGFNSEMFLAPDDGVGVIAFSNGARGAMLWLPAEISSLLNHELGVPDPVIRTDVPQHPEIWPELCGWYRVPARLTDARAREMVGAGVEVFVRRGRLMLRALSPVPAVYRGFPLHPDDEKDPYAFRIDFSRYGMGTGRIVFSREPGAGVTAVHFELLPVSAHKRTAMRHRLAWTA
jgi:CubicO group peptidase (beta-lactamase class C family)